MDIWDLLKSLFSGGLSITTPRDLMLSYIYGSMVDSPTPDINVQQYYDWLSMFRWIALILLVVELCIRLWRGTSNDSLGYEMKQYGFSLGFYVVALPSIPAFLMGARLFGNALGKFFLTGFVGGDKNAFMTSVSALSGVAPVDVVLSIIQFVFLVVLTLSLYAIPVMFVVSCILFMVGVSTRWMGAFGDKLFGLSLLVTLYGALGNGIIMAILGVGVAAGKLVFPDDAYARASVNTVVIIVAASVTGWVLKSVKEDVKAMVKNAKDGYQNVRGKLHGETPQYERAGGKRQVDETVNANTRHGSNNDANAGSSANTAPNKAQGDQAASHEATPAETPRHSSTAARSLTRRQSDQPQRGQEPNPDASQASQPASATPDRSTSRQETGSPRTSEPVPQERPSAPHSAQAASSPRPTTTGGQAHTSAIREEPYTGSRHGLPETEYTTKQTQTAERSRA